MIGEEYPGQVAEIKWTSRDFKRTTRFYQKLFGWKLHHFPDQGILSASLPRGDFTCTFRQSNRPGSGGSKVVIHVASLAATEKRVRELGGTWSGYRIERFGAQTIEVEDPDGNVLILVDGAEGKA